VRQHCVHRVRLDEQGCHGADRRGHPRRLRRIDRSDEHDRAVEHVRRAQVVQPLVGDDPAHPGAGEIVRPSDAQRPILQRDAFAGERDTISARVDGPGAGLHRGEAERQADGEIGRRLLISFHQEVGDLEVRSTLDAVHARKFGHRAHDVDGCRRLDADARHIARQHVDSEACQQWEISVISVSEGDVVERNHGEALHVVGGDDVPRGTSAVGERTAVEIDQPDRGGPTGSGHCNDVLHEQRVPGRHVVRHRTVDGRVEGNHDHAWVRSGVCSGQCIGRPIADHRLRCDPGDDAQCTEACTNADAQQAVAVDG